MVGTLLLICRRSRLSPLLAAALAFLGLVGFVILARPSPSVLRAATMAGISLYALARGRGKEQVPTLAAAVLALLLWQPTLGRDAGFAMSVLATLSLLLVAPSWAQTLRRWLPWGLAELCAVAAAAHVATLPVVVGVSGSVSLLAIPANMIAEPVVAPITLLGTLAAILSVVWLPSAQLVAQLAGFGCSWLVWVARHFSAVDGGAIGWPRGWAGALLITITVGVLVVAVRRPSLRPPLLVACLVASVIQIPLRGLIGGWPPPGWFVVMCDVGQGDAVVLNAGPREAVLIDTGPDPVTVDRCLTEVGITQIDLLVLTHFHLDHVGGIGGAVGHRHVGQAIVSTLAEPSSGVADVMRALGSASVQPLPAEVGAELVVGAVRLHMLGPDRAYGGTRSDPNNSSVVMQATIAGHTVLLPGDVEVAAQQDLLSRGDDLRSDVLKVPHHGSAYFDDAFLRAVHPALGLISVGKNNDYGHPAPSLLSEMDRLAVPVWRTDQSGDIALVATGDRLEVLSHHSTRQ